MVQATWSGHTRRFETADEAYEWVEKLEKLAETDYDAAERCAYSENWKEFHA